MPESDAGSNLGHNRPAEYAPTLDRHNLPVPIAPERHGIHVVHSPHTADAPAKVSVTAILHGLRRCWVLAMGLGLVCALAGGAAAWYGLPPDKHTAQAL